MEITRSPVRVGIFGSEASVLAECANELHQAGYVLNFSSSLKSRNEPDDDIFIVGMSEFADSDNLALWKNTPSPFLISGIDSFPHNSAVLDALNSAVGYIRSAPTLTEILLNLRLGLHWHNERSSHSKRINNIETKIENNRIIGMAVGVLMNNYGESEQRVFDSLKTISRNNQRKISSVAQEILAKHSERNYQADDNKQASSLHTWLSNNITVQVR
tara:strand:- start:266161 stop:266808 length:648 start_codon:yes stop_codon:yes gene_type:complete